MHPHSRPGKLGVVDGRRAEAKFMMKVRTDLMRHVGVDPTAMQRLIVEQCVALSLRIHLMDREFFKQGGMTGDYVTLVDARSRLLQQLGINAAASPEPAADA
jgi:hypothetical protein